MKLGYGPLDVTNMSAADIRSDIGLLESKGYEFVVLSSSTDAIIATAIAAPISRDMRLIVTFDRQIDPLRDAEDLVELDHISGGRIAVALGPGAVNEIELAEEMLLALAGKMVRGVRVFPRPAQFTIPMVAPADYAARLGAVSTSAEIVEDHFVMLNIEDVVVRRQEITNRTPFALSVSCSDVSKLDELVTAQHLREALYVDDKAQRMMRKMPSAPLEASDLDSPIHRI